MNLEDAEYFDHLILEGAIEVAALGPDGEFLFNITDKLKDIDPHMYEAVLGGLRTEIYTLWTEGFINIYGPDMANPLVRLTEKSYNLDAVSLLPDRLQSTIEFIKKSMTEDIDK